MWQHKTQNKNRAVGVSRPTHEQAIRDPAKETPIGGGRERITTVDPQAQVKPYYL